MCVASRWAIWSRDDDPPAVMDSSFGDGGSSWQKPVRVAARSLSSINENQDAEKSRQSSQRQLTHSPAHTPRRLDLIGTRPHRPGHQRTKRRYPIRSPRHCHFAVEFVDTTPHRHPLPGSPSEARRQDTQANYSRQSSFKSTCSNPSGPSSVTAVMTEHRT
jgi:hypothetical protein